MSRRRRPSALDPFGLSFLDLVSCAFAGVLILYLTADADEVPAEGDPSVLRMVEVQTAHALPATLGLRLRSGSDTWTSWQSDEHEAVRWLRAAGRTVWVFHGEVDALDVEVVALDLPPHLLGRSFDVLLLQNGREIDSLTLRPDTLYRATRSLP
ncbi:MAG: hypothetical protein AAGE94_14210 [Acidobacteriota bacterium]